MKLTKVERLTLMNQHKILALLDEEEREHHEQMVEILRNGYASLYDDLTEELSDELSEADGDFVLDVLNMHLAIQRVAQDAGVDTREEGNWALQMRGFDGNNESQMLRFARFTAQEEGSAYGQFLVNGQFPNSHSRSVEFHQRMLDEYEEMGGASGLMASGAKGLERLKRAAIHPEHR